MIVRRERPHPGAQLSFTDHDGHRFQAILTDRTPRAPPMERRASRARPREDHIRTTRTRASESCPSRLRDEPVWLALVLLAHDSSAGPTPASARRTPGLEPKRLRYRALHAAARLAFHARRANLRLEPRWPWAKDLAAAFVRLGPVACACRLSAPPRRCWGRAFPYVDLVRKARSRYARSRSRDCPSTPSLTE